MKISTVIMIVSLLLLGADTAFARDVTFGWTASPVPEQIDGYNLYSRPAGTTDWTITVINGGNTNTFTLPALEIDVSYEFNITAWRNTWDGQPVEYAEGPMTDMLTLPAISDLPPVSPLGGFHIIKVE
ncbi:MAG: fibronectin type III domain-containing protein [Candidatus Neomarinimicrobiota bacterium]